MRKVGHQRVAVIAADFDEYAVGQRVMTKDGYPGVVTAVMDGPYPQTEAYDVTLDNNMGGGEYRVGELSPYSAAQASRAVESELVEASTAHMASDDYPELSAILMERLPNENLRTTAAKGDGNPFAKKKDEDDETEGNSSEDESDKSQGSESNPFDSFDDDDQEEESGDESSAPGVGTQGSPADNIIPVDPPDSCSFCGNNSFEDPQNTGRGTRMRCSQCKGTMTSWGGQWQPETPGSSQNAASGQADFRSGGAAGVVEAPGANFKASSLDDHGLNFHLTASWFDVRQKAKRLRSEGAVEITGAIPGAVLGQVRGDTAVYEAELKYLPGSKRVANWFCGCAWAGYANEPRFGQWKKFQNRLCSHALALQYEAQSQGMFGREVTAAVEGSLDPDEVYAHSQALDLINPPLYAYAQRMSDNGVSPVDSIHILGSLGADRSLAQALVVRAAKETQTATAEPGQGLDAKAPRQEDRDQSDAATKKEHRLHHTNDGRQHAPNWGWGLPWYMQNTLGVCQQCNGSGCGHCGGMGQTNQTPPGQPDSPAVSDSTGDAGDLSNGISAAGMLYEADQGYFNIMGPAPTDGEFHSDTQHSESENPASTGWATGQDPKDWRQENRLDRGFGDSFNGSLHDKPEPALPSTDGAEDDPDEASKIVAAFQASAAAKAIMSDAPTMSRVAMKTFDHGEQMELINEGAREKVRARNFGELQIAGTHYALLSDDDEDLGSFL